MSAIAGLCNVDGQPVAAHLLAGMLDRLAARGPHGRGQWVSRSVGLGHRLLHATPESLKEHQPLSDAWGDCWLVWDGRVDNREELSALLRADGAPLGAETDPELVLHAYRKWGAQCLQRIVGEFALALWDGRTRTLLCARDPLGVKPFYYCWNGRRLVFASEMHALLADPALAKGPNDAMIADYLLASFRDPDATFFEGVNQLRPGHFLQTHNGGLSVQRYWNFDPAREVRYGREEEYLDHFRDLFREAVRCRLRSDRPVGVLLSGGIDSTAVTGMAETIRRQDASLPALNALTILFDGFLAEEWQPIQSLVARYGTAVQTIAHKGPDGPMTRFEALLASSQTLHYDAFMTLPFVLAPAAANGSSVLLTGFGSDELFRSAEFGFQEDLFRAGRFVRLRAELAREVRAYGGVGGGNLPAFLWTQLPVRLRRLVKILSRRQVPQWIAPSFADRMGLARRTAPAGPRTFRTLCQEEPARALTVPSMALALNWMDAACSAFSIECRHPYLDRRLIEFFLAIPSDVKVSGGYRKMLLQRATQEVSAGPLRPRECVGPLCVPEMDLRMERERDARLLARNLFHPNALVFRYVDRAAAERIQERYLSGEDGCRNLLWQFTDLEQWLQTYCPNRTAPRKEGP